MKTFEYGHPLWNAFGSWRNNTHLISADRIHEFNFIGIIFLDETTVERCLRPAIQHITDAACVHPKNK